MKRRWNYNRRYALFQPLLICVIALSLFSSCGKEKIDSNGKESWQTELEAQLPLLGHRNWIVVTDMAYPLQSRTGVQTLYADAPYEEVLRFVDQTIAQHPHVSQIVYQDEELNALDETLCPGIDAFKESVASVLGKEAITYIPHEQLIARLDSVSQTFQVVIIKTNLLKPYTSTFFELGCKYWK